MKSIKKSDIFAAVIVLAIIMLIIAPLPPGVLDVLILLNIVVSVIILLITMYITNALQFSIFPSLLLFTTLMRMALSISSTRLILGNSGNAGKVIDTFGSFVIGDNIVVGAVVFIIIVLVQFIVITKGAERVSEVAARFTLDAMPGKQMAIDADLNSGLIDESIAKQRRADIQREADFFGAMDGASKFVKGDAIMGIIITLINAVGGLIIGFTEGGELMDIISKYTLLTVGDGLVTQIPALLVSTSMGVVVTRSASTDSMGGELIKQFSGQPLALILGGVLLIFLSFVQGMPKVPMFIIAGVLIALGIVMIRRTAAQEAELAQVETTDDEAERIAAEKRKPENVTSLLDVPPIELELGYAIITLVDVSQGGDLLDRVVMIRRQCALDLGIIVPSIRLRDNIQLGNNEYVIKIKGVEVSRGEVLLDHFMALNPGGATEMLDGIPTVEPAFGLPAQWITEKEREKADLYGYTTIDPPSVIATHLTEIIKRYGFELLSRQQVQTLLENVRRTQPALVEEVVPKMFSLGEIQKVLANLLRENIPVRDMVTILETLSDYGGITRDTDLLTEYCRQALRRAVSRRFVPDNKARVITLDPRLEQVITEHVRQTEHGSFVSMEPDAVQRIFLNLKNAIERMTNMGMTPIVLTSPAVRRHFKRITEQMVPDLIVLSYNELEQNVEVFSDWVVNIAS